MSKLVRSIFIIAIVLVFASAVKMFMKNADLRKQVEQGREK